MGHQRNDAEVGSFAEQAPLLSPLVYKPANSVDEYFQVTDPSAISVGDDLVQFAAAMNGVEPILPRVGFHLTYTDAASSDFFGIIEVVGINHYGVRISENISMNGQSPSAAYFPTGRAYLKVEQLNVLIWDNAQAADQLEMGFALGSAANTNSTRLRLGLPVGIREPSDYLGVVMTVPPTEVGKLKTIGQFNAARGTFTLDEGSVATGRVLQFVMNPDNPKL